jgi:hypothetical protein
MTKIGRNDPCPCGSGKKFKKCHGVGTPPSDETLRGEERTPPRLRRPFSEMVATARARREEIESLFVDEFAFVDDCLALTAEIVAALGDIPPVAVEDVAIRDVSCDTFEFLYEARQALAENRPSIVFPALRRAFETASLCHLFVVKPEFAEKWSKGGKISNADVRKHLEGHPLVESVERLRQEYGFFSQGAHPNRTHLPFVFLGEGNKFTLGAIPPIDPLNLGLHVAHLMRICYWHVGVFMWRYRTLMAKLGEPFATDFLQLRPRMERLISTLDGQLEHLHKEHAKEPKPEGVGPALL